MEASKTRKLFASTDVKCSTHLASILFGEVYFPPKSPIRLPPIFRLISLPTPANCGREIPGGMNEMWRGSGTGNNSGRGENCAECFDFESPLLLPKQLFEDK
jgi:hypothetical protein